jgi:hypothetical protein
VDFLTTTVILRKIPSDAMLTDRGAVFKTALEHTFALL